MLSRAYPNGIPQDDYFPLLWLLAEEMSEEGIANVFVHIPGFEPIVVANDVAKSLSTHWPSAEQIKRVKKNLAKFGYEMWLREEG